MGWDGMGQGVCEVSESHAGRSGQIRAGGQGGGGGERMAGGGRRLRQSVRACAWRVRWQTGGHAARAEQEGGRCNDYAPRACVQQEEQR